eukprot:SAG31_NODE_23227_length_508_cov_1.750611_1_plen_78_part_01
MMVSTNASLTTCLDEDSWRTLVGEVCAGSLEEGDWVVEATVRGAAERLAETASRFKCRILLDFPLFFIHILYFSLVSL